MRPGPRPRPEREGLLGLPLHVLVGDYPEVLRVLRDRGVDASAHGSLTLAELEASREDGGALVSDLLDATHWRPLR